MRKISIHFKRFHANYVLTKTTAFKRELKFLTLLQFYYK